VILVCIGFNAMTQGGVQSPHTLALMKLCYFAAPAAGAIVALFLLRRYTLTEARAYEIEAALKQRRRAANP
jgi:Na+/melibiose symporter-like transporter